MFKFSIIEKIYGFLQNHCCDSVNRAEILRKKGYLIGNDCEIFDNVSFGSEPYLIQIGNNVKIASGCTFITHDGGMHVLRNLNLLPNSDKFNPIFIGDNVFIGMKSIILPGVHIGKNCVIGAGSIVVKDIPPNTVAAGIPAKVLKTVEQYYLENKDKVDFTKQLSSNAKRGYLLDKYRRIKA